MYRALLALPFGAGVKYRATIIGPGVTPEIYWSGNAPGPYNPELDRIANEAILALHTALCRPN